ncbi:drebrin-like protein B isoform X1, partial [Clarias magur]
VERELQAAEWKGIRSSRSLQEASGSKYDKTSALEEINAIDRESFWAQLEKEEQTRREEERKKAEQEQQRLKREREEQEERETAERERQQKERTKQIDQQRLFEKRQEIQQQQQEPVERELQAAEWKGIRSSRSLQEASGLKYDKTSALEEMNAIDRESFWAQLEKEEKTRREEERKKAEQERQRLEREREEQEERETAERERQQRERAKQIDQQRLQEKKQESTNNNQQKSVERELQAAEWKGIRSSRSVQEASDAAAIISQRSINPRDIFLQKQTNFTNKVSETQPGKSSNRTSAYNTVIAANEEEQLENIYDKVPTYRRVCNGVEDDADKRSSDVQVNHKAYKARALYDYQA